MKSPLDLVGRRYTVPDARRLAMTRVAHLPSKD
jgi:hypothetical protein